MLGFKILGESLNYGIEQDRLSGSTGAKVRTTTLEASRGPLIELQESLIPMTDRLKASESPKVNRKDWQICLHAPHLLKLRELLLSNGYSHLPLMLFSHSHFLYHQVFMVEDPVGHELLIMH